VFKLTSILASIIAIVNLIRAADAQPIEASATVDLAGFMVGDTVITPEGCAGEILAYGNPHNDIAGLWVYVCGFDPAYNSSFGRWYIPEALELVGVN
jgi:hypothetical protein